VPLPAMWKPGIRMLPPVPTIARVEMFVSRTVCEPGAYTLSVAAALVVEPAVSVTVTV
jgi:hypothetical protein